MYTHWFDLPRIAIDTDGFTVLVSDELQQTVYAQLHGTALRLPANPKLRPNKQALDKHGREAGL